MPHSIQFDDGTLVRLFPGHYRLGRKGETTDIVLGGGVDKSIRCAFRWRATL